MGHRNIQRHSAYKVGYHALELQLEAGDNYEAMAGDYPVVAAVPSAYAAKGSFPDALGVNPSITAIAGGVPFTMGGFPVVTIFDREEGTKNAVMSATGPAGIWLKFDNTDAANVAPGKKLYMIPDATAVTGGLLTTDPDGGTNLPFGRCLITAAEYAAAQVVTAAVNTRPTGYYVKVQKLNW